MADKCYLVLGGGGMVGFQIAQRIARRLKPDKVVIASLFQQEVRQAIHALEKEFPGVTFIGFWGDVFIRSQFNVEDRQQRRNRRSLLADAENRAGLYDDLFGNTEKAYRRAQLVQLIIEHRPNVIVDAINTATAISYQDIYTASTLARRDLDALIDSRKETQTSVINNRVDQAAETFETLMISQYIPQLIRHVVFIQRAMGEVATRLYIKVGTTGTGGMGLNIPYTHGEDKPSAKLMSKTAIAFAHTGLMFLMARTPSGGEDGVPTVIKEIKPAAMVGWIDITHRSIHQAGKQAYIYESQSETLNEQLTLRVDKKQMERISKLRIPVVDTGENGLFTKGEFEAITSLRQMEFMTPEEIARVVELEIRGVNTGKDVIAAVDGAIMGPTYRAGYLRQQALEELNRIETKTGTPSVALGELGPPELSKLLWESYLLKEVYGTLTAVLKHSQEDEEYDNHHEVDLRRSPSEIAASLHEYLLENPCVAHIITSVGIPILLPDGGTVLRGHFIRIPETAGRQKVDIQPGDIDTWASKGWVDLRPSNIAHWQERFDIMLRAKLRLRGKGSAAVNREAYLYEDIFIGEVVSWIFSNEMRGYRLK
jgi:hypothetical protein